MYAVLSKQSKKDRNSNFRLFSINNLYNIDRIMNNNELEKSKSYITKEIIEYIPNSVVSKTILKKSTGNIRVMSFDDGEGLAEKTSPFDTFVQIIEGKAEIIIDGTSLLLETGESIIIPAHKPNLVKSNRRFKMILTVIKSGYEWR